MPTNGDSLRRTWYALREFETRDITSRHYKDRHKRELGAGNAREIASNFIQAREYFRSASDADTVVRPLLQYYGVSALSRGLVLFLNTQRRESSIKPSHGLKTCDWRGTLSGGLTKIGDLRIGLEKGIFYDLLVATENTFYFRGRNFAKNWRVSVNIPTTGAEFVFSDITSRIPDVSEQYTTWTGRSYSFARLRRFKNNCHRNQLEFTVLLHEDTDVYDIFPKKECPNLKIDSDNTGIIVRYDYPYIPFISQLSGRLGSGEVILYPPARTGYLFHSIGSMFYVLLYPWYAGQVLSYNLD